MVARWSHSWRKTFKILKIGGPRFLSQKGCYGSLKTIVGVGVSPRVKGCLFYASVCLVDALFCEWEGMIIDEVVFPLVLRCCASFMWDCVSFFFFEACLVLLAIVSVRFAFGIFFFCSWLEGSWRHAGLVCLVCSPCPSAMPCFWLIAICYYLLVILWVKVLLIHSWGWGGWLHLISVWNYWAIQLEFFTDFFWSRTRTQSVHGKS